MAINPDIASDIGEHGQFTSDASSGAEIFWNGAGDGLPAFSLPCPGRYERSNGESYFNSTGNPGDWTLEISSSSTDHHSGWEHINAGQIVTIEERKQMIIKGKIKLEGKLKICGKLVLF